MTTDNTLIRVLKSIKIAGGDIAAQENGFITAKYIIKNNGNAIEAIYYGIESGLKMMLNKKRNITNSQKLMRAQA